MTDNVVRLFFDAAARSPSAAAFRSHGGGRVEFGALRSQVEAFASGLASNGFRTGDRAVFVLPMSVPLYVAVLGALTAGGTAVFVDPWLSLGQIARLLAAASPTAFVGTPKAHALRLFEPALRRIPITVSSDGFGAGLAARFRFSDFRGSASVAAVSPDAPALITYTTGSSGNPKGVTRTHAILGAQHDVIREEFPAREGDVDLTTFPVFALSNLAAGVTTVIPPVDLRRVADADGAAVLRDVRAFGVTTIAASPPLLDRVAECLRATRETPPALRRVVTGGAPVSDEQLRRWREALPTSEIVVAYGSSEAEPVASMTAEERFAAAGSGFCVGKPVHALRARVVPITREPLARLEDVPRGHIGELVVAGPHVCRDYVGDPAAFAENKFRDSDGTVWHRMGDTGWFDDEGRFRVAGRVHSTIRRNGVDYHAQLVEQEIGAIAASRAWRVAALAVPHRGSDRLAVVVDAADKDRETLAAEIRQGSDLPLDHIIFEQIPVDPRHNSKVDYSRLRKIVMEKINP